MSRDNKVKSTRLDYFDVPPLRYVGAKWQLAEWICDHFPPHEKYVEPFCGSAAVFFRKWPSKLEILNDLDGEVINFFQVLRSQKDELLEQIQLTPFSRREYEMAIEPVRRGVTAIERARRFYVGTWQSFGSTLIYRSGFRTQVTPHMRSSLTSTWKRMDGIMAAADRLRDAILESQEAIRVIEQYDCKDTLFYIDPPYVLSSRTQGGRRRYRHEMTDGAHVRLLETITRVDGMVVLSGYDNDLYREHLSGWYCTSKTTTTNGNQSATECLWVSPRANDVTALPMFRGVGV